MSATTLNPPQTSVSEAPPLTRIEPRGPWLEIPAREIWKNRELLYFFIWRDIKVRYKQTAIGIAWAVLQPLLAMLVFTLFFGRLAHMQSDGLPYSVFSYAGLLPWMYFAAALQNGTNTIVENQHIITKVYFPRLVLPLAAVIAALVDFAISFALFGGMMAYHRIRPGPALILFPLFLALAVLTALGVGLWLSALNAMYRDVRYVVPFLIQFWMFASPVVYPSSLVPARWRWLYGFNPMAGVIDGFRWSITGHGPRPAAMVMVSAAVVLLLFVGGVFYFQRMETRVADVV